MENGIIQNAPSDVFTFNIKPGIKSSHVAVLQRTVMNNARVSHCLFCDVLVIFSVMPVKVPNITETYCSRDFCCTK